MERKSLKFYLLKYRTYFIAGLAVILLASVILTMALVSRDDSKPANTTPLSFVMPIANVTIKKGYNAEELQYNKTLNCWEIHKGLDLLAEKGEDVLACYTGTVTDIYTNYLEGTTVVLEHENGLSSVYVGLDSNLSVEVGDSVSTGQKLGVVGTTSSTELDDGSHVHFELLKDGEKVDPANYLDIDLKG